ncbi:MAG: respiratory nitrate reductase subunit gamma [Lysobacter sp.]
MNYLNTFAFQIYPYIALAVFLLGSWVRFDHDPYSWRSGSSQLLSGKWMRMGSNLFHVGVIAILLGHLVGLLTPHVLYERFLLAGQKQFLAMVVGGFFGVLCLIGISILLVRRLFDPRVRATGMFRDTLVLVLLFVQLLLGMISIAVSTQHMDGVQMLKLANWAQAIVTFTPGAAGYLTDAHWIYKAHIFLGLTLFLIFPFTRLVHIWSIPLGYLRRPYQVVRKRQAPVNYTGK